MRQLIENYTFSTSAKTVTLTDFTTLHLERLLLITDVNTNTLLYNFANPAVSTASVSGNVITLSTMGSASGSDKLQIIYDSLSTDPIYDTTTIVDGADSTQGSVNDSANTTGTTGSVSGKLRGLVSILGSTWDSTDGLLKVSLATALTQAFDSVLTYPRGYNYAHITATSLVLTGAGKLHGVFINSGTPTLEFWDSTTGSGTIANNTFQAAAVTYYNLGDARMINGIYVTITGTADITVYFDPTTT